MSTRRGICIRPTPSRLSKRRCVTMTSFTFLRSLFYVVSSSELSRRLIQADLNMYSRGVAFRGNSLTDHECREELREGLAVELLYLNLPHFFHSAVHDSGTAESTIRVEYAAVENLVPLLARAYRCVFVYTLRLQLREWQEHLKQS